MITAVAERRIVVRIESLVVDEMSAADANKFGRALQREIERHFRHSSVFETLRATRSTKHLQANLASPRASDPAAFGTDVGRALEHAIGRGSPRRR